MSSRFVVDVAASWKCRAARAGQRSWSKIKRLGHEIKENGKILQEDITALINAFRRELARLVGMRNKEMGRLEARRRRVRKRRELRRARLSQRRYVNTANTTSEDDADVTASDSSSLEEASDSSAEEEIQDLFKVDSAQIQNLTQQIEMLKKQLARLASSQTVQSTPPQAAPVAPVAPKTAPSAPSAPQAPLAPKAPAAPKAPVAPMAPKAPKQSPAKSPAAAGSRNALLSAIRSHAGRASLSETKKSAASFQSPPASSPGSSVITPELIKTTGLRKTHRQHSGWKEGVPSMSLSSAIQRARTSLRKTSDSPARPRRASASAVGQKATSAAQPTLRRRHSVLGGKKRVFTRRIPGSDSMSLGQELQISAKFKLRNTGMKRSPGGTPRRSKRDTKNPFHRALFQKFKSTRNSPDSEEMSPPPPRTTYHHNSPRIPDTPSRALKHIVQKHHAKPTEDDWSSSESEAEEEDPNKENMLSQPLFSSPTSRS